MNAAEVSDTEPVVVLVNHETRITAMEERQTRIEALLWAAAGSSILTLLGFVFTLARFGAPH